MSLDVSSTAIGWAFYSNKELVHHGRITTTKSWKAAKRVMCMINDLSTLINRDEIFGGRIDVVVVEDGIYCRDFAGSFSLGGALMAVEIFFMRNNISVEKIEVNVWKKIFTGKGNAKKHDIARRIFDSGIIKGIISNIDEVKERLTYHYGDGILKEMIFDESDAIGLGWAYSEKDSV